jgi:hypothetical protein
MAREEIGYAVREFTDGDEHSMFWGYFPAYDWVAFNWLFGHMDELPFHYSQLCLDNKGCQPENVSNYRVLWRNTEG